MLLLPPYTPLSAQIKPHWECWVEEQQPPTKQVQKVLSMPTLALYDVLQSFQDIHRVVINLAGELNDEQLRWKPEGYSTSIGFHLWHLARESDYLRAALLQYYPQLGSEFGNGVQIWQQEGLAQKWGFPPGLYETVGTGLSDETAALLPIPKKEELLAYLHASYKAVEAFVELLDSKYANFEGMSEELCKQVGM
ncbi:MAG: DinB family protein, partial [Byssovorax cruenta]